MNRKLAAQIKVRRAKKPKHCFWNARIFTSSVLGWIGRIALFGISPPLASGAMVYFTQGATPAAVLRFKIVGVESGLLLVIVGVLYWLYRNGKLGHMGDPL